MANHLLYKIKYIFIIWVVAFYCTSGLWIKNPALAQDISRVDQSRVQNKFQQIDLDSEIFLLKMLNSV